MTSDYWCALFSGQTATYVHTIVFDTMVKFLRYLAYLRVQILVKRRRHRSSLFDNKERFLSEA